MRYNQRYSFGQGVRVHLLKGCRGKIDPVVIFDSFGKVFISSKSSNGFLKRSGTVFTNKLFLFINPPGPFQDRPSLNLCLRIRSALRTRGNVENQSSEANR